MVLSRQIVSDGLPSELDRFVALIRPLSDDEWNTATRCVGWTVADVAAHLVGTLTDVTQGRFDGLGTAEVTQREVDERKGLAPGQIADECEEARAGAAGLLAAFDDAAWAGPGPDGVDGTLGWGVEALWYDVYLHADDIRSAIGQPSEYGAGLAAAVSHVRHQVGLLGWDGSGPDGVAAAPGGGAAALEFVLAATGRAPAGPAGPPNIYAE